MTKPTELIAEFVQLSNAMTKLLELLEDADISPELSADIKALHDNWIDNQPYKRYD